MIDTAPAPVTVPMEPTTPIKPSEALRLGRLLRPRRLDLEMFDGEDGACAIGAVHVGRGGSPEGGDFMETVRWLRQLDVEPFDGLYSAYSRGQNLCDDDAALAYLESLGL